MDVPWCVAAGWALDLFRGEQTRPHEDLEIAVSPYRRGGSTRSRSGSPRWTSTRSATAAPCRTRKPPSGLTRRGHWTPTRRSGGWTCSASRPRTGSGHAGGTPRSGCRTAS
ncbi:MAG: nucleotidyltransferase domain-containing protein [Micromonosporaceae bacterium]